ncbi:MAG: hypothetical protein AABX07_01350 [Nanoarchaeota archaeon]
MAENQPEKISKDELIGFHKGSLNTLIAERNEILKMVNITEQLIQAHIKELEALGIKLTTSKPEAENIKQN